MNDTVLPVTGASPYDVVVGTDLADRLPAMLGPGVQRVGVVFPESLADLARPLLDSLAGAHEVTRLPIPGVAVVHVPTTLLAMVDAAVGGKTGINTAQGKNLVGAFHEPAGVLCDLATLRSLPRAELVAGLGEVVKCGFIADPQILTLVEGTDPDELTADSPVLRELVERAIRVKIDVVVSDLKETGGQDGHPGREVLNYGHTMAHAIERAEDYAVRHGEAVALGCVYVAELARRAGTLAPEVVERHHRAFAHVGLPTTYTGASFEELHAAMKVDKKARGSQLRFVVLTDLAVPTVLAGPSEDDLRAAYDVLSGREQEVDA